MIYISPDISLGDHEVEFTAVGAQGPGGQHVNKTSSAIHLRFDIKNSSLPPEIKQRLLRISDNRISKDGILIIKSQDVRSQLRNKEEAINRLQVLIQAAMHVPRKRVPTKPGKGSVRRRLDSKTKKGRDKQLRKPVQPD
jgi:ribosome-associated protein